MTIHFHTKHFLFTDLELLEYMMLLIYENFQPNNKQIGESLKISQRTVYRIRDGLIEKEYLIKSKNSNYQVTDKMYPLIKSEKKLQTA